MAHPDSLIDAQIAEQALRRLPDEDRQIVVLRIWGELGFAQIADIVQMSMTTVHKRYGAALKATSQRTGEAMQEQDGLNPAERELEFALKSVNAAPARVDCVAAAFAAGKQSVRGPLRFWQTAAVLMLAVSAGSWLMPSRRDGGLQPRDGAAPSISRDTSPAIVEPALPQSMVALRAAVREKGLEGLPSPHLPSGAMIRVRDINLTSQGDL